MRGHLGGLAGALEREEGAAVDRPAQHLLALLRPHEGEVDDLHALEAHRVPVQTCEEGYHQGINAVRRTITNKAK